MTNEFKVSSPAGTITIAIRLTDKIYYSIVKGSTTILWYSPISMTLSDGTVLGHQPHLIGEEALHIHQSISTIWGIRSEIEDRYHELTLQFKGNYSLIFRAYEDGVAYRFATRLPGTIRIIEEDVHWRFLDNHPLLAHVVGDFQTSYEQLYTSYSILDVKEAEFISLPLLVDQGNCKLVISEADLYDYPGMYIMRKEGSARPHLNALFPNYPTQWEPGGHCQFNLRVTDRADYMAETTGTRSFPWRCIAIAQEDKDLLNSDLVYKLSRPSVIATDWIQPGKVAWEWWNDWNLTGVDFETGVNHSTYQYYIDFAAQNHIEYVLLDEGWSDQFDLFLQRPGMDVPYLVKYARERGVKIVLWCVWYTLDRQMQAALDLFEQWGVAGIKVDFIDRDDQITIKFYERLAGEAPSENY